MEDREEERGRRSPGALRPLKDTAEESVYCKNCLRVIDRTQNTPKLLRSEKVLCLNCTTTEVNEGPEMLCRKCWKCTEPTNSVPLQALRRTPCRDPFSPNGPGLSTHAPTAFGDALHSAIATGTMQLLRTDLNNFSARQRDFLLRALAAINTLKLRIEAELSCTPPISPPPPATPPRSSVALINIEHLNQRRTSALLHCRLDDLVASAAVLLDFKQMERALMGLYQPDTLRGLSDQSEVDPVLFLANYCSAQLYKRTCPQQPDEFDPGAPPLLRMPFSYPLFYFNLEVNGLAFGRFVIEVHNDVAPRMARNFSALSTGELGIGYRGCAIFQCWENESVITGDFELNNGRGGYSVYEKGFFVPDETKLDPVRGSVGMRRSQKRRNHWGLVGSQFRIILREMRGFTAIFGYVVEGLELVEQLSCTGNSAGKPRSAIVICGCGKLN